MMPRSVIWKLRFQDQASVNDNARLDGFLNLVNPAKFGEAKPCEERPELWEVSMTTEFASPPANGVLNLLQTASCLASGWIVYGPVLSEDGEVLDFFGNFKELNNTRAQVWGLKWATFEVAQLPPSHEP
jgi:hypothetical protein